MRCCRGLGWWGGSPDGGSVVLLGRARRSVLPGGHGRVGGVVAGAKICSIFGRTSGGVARSLLEGIVAALIARRAAPGETLILGSAALRCRNLPEGTVLELTVRRMWLHFFAVVWSLLESPVALVVLGVMLLRSAPMYPALGVYVSGDGVRLYRIVVGRCFI